MRSTSYGTCRNSTRSLGPAPASPGRGERALDVVGEVPELDAQSGPVHVEHGVLGPGVAADRLAPVLVRETDAAGAEPERRPGAPLPLEVDVPGRDGGRRAGAN